LENLVELRRKQRVIPLEMSAIYSFIDRLCHDIFVAVASIVALSLALPECTPWY
jgi:hypothetical protein